MYPSLLKSGSGGIGTIASDPGVAGGTIQD